MVHRCAKHDVRTHPKKRSPSRKGAKHGRRIIEDSRENRRTNLRRTLSPRQMGGFKLLDTRQILNARPQRLRHRSRRRSRTQRGGRARPSRSRRRTSRPAQSRRQAHRTGERHERTFRHQRHRAHLRRHQRRTSSRTQNTIGGTAGHRRLRVPQRRSQRTGRRSRRHRRSMDAHHQHQPQRHLPYRPHRA